MAGWRGERKDCSLDEGYGQADMAIGPDQELDDCHDGVVARH